MAGPLFPQTAVNVPIAGARDWGNPQNARQTDGFGAFVEIGTVPGFLETSAALVVTDFGFSIPNGSTIEGIEVVVKRDGQATGGSGTPSDFGIFIVKGGVATGVDHSNLIPWSGTFPDITYGSNSDLWGETWTAADINDSGFGLSIRARKPGARAQGRVDSVRITVYVSLPITYGCIGFDSPLDNPATPVVVRKPNRALPFKADLVDGTGNLVTDTTISAPPVIQVIYSPGVSGTPVDISGETLAVGLGTGGNQFVFTDEFKWQYNLKLGKNNAFSAPGTYMVTMEPGDAYLINPTCTAKFVIQ
jgi:hypothetical protein